MEKQHRQLITHPVKKYTVIFSSLLLSMSLISCDKVKEQAAEKAKEVATEKMNEVVNETIEKASEEVKEQLNTTATTAIEEPKKSAINFDGEFDWSKIPVSTADIGSFPYISAPEGMSLWINDSSSKSAPADQPYTTYWDFNKLIMFDGSNVIHAEGKRAFLHFKMTDDSDFAQFKFDKSVKDYLKRIGAVEIFNARIPDEVIEKLGNDTISDYMTGDIWNKPVRHYALNHTNGKIFFQAMTDRSEIGVVKLEGFKQTIKAPTASEIKQQLDADGKAVLHINFDTAKASMKSDGQAIVEQINVLLTQNPDIKLSIEGHTDNVGDSSANKKLSENRANTVMYALAGKGIDVSRLSAKGFGDTAPIADNSSDEGKAKNRRVELVKQ